MRRPRPIQWLKTRAANRQAAQSAAGAGGAGPAGHTAEPPKTFMSMLFGPITRVFLRTIFIIIVLMLVAKLGFILFHVHTDLEIRGTVDLGELF